MKAAVIVIAALALSACQRSSQDEAVLAAFPQSIKIPECSLKVLLSHAHWRRDPNAPFRYVDVARIRIDSSCADEWERSLLSKNTSRCTDNCPVYAETTDHHHILVSRNRDDGDVFGIAWMHNDPVSGIDYEEPPLRLEK